LAVTALLADLLADLLAGLALGLTLDLTLVLFVLAGAFTACLLWARVRG